MKELYATAAAATAVEHQQWNGKEALDKNYLGNRYI